MFDEKNLLHVIPRTTKRSFWPLIAFIEIFCFLIPAKTFIEIVSVIFRFPYYTDPLFMLIMYSLNETQLQRNSICINKWKSETSPTQSQFGHLFCTFLSATQPPQTGFVQNAHRSNVLLRQYAHCLLLSDCTDCGSKGSSSRGVFSAPISSSTSIFKYFRLLIVVPRALLYKMWALIAAISRRLKKTASCTPDFTDIDLHILSKISTPYFVSL